MDQQCACPNRRWTGRRKNHDDDSGDVHLFAIVRGGRLKAMQAMARRSPLTASALSNNVLGSSAPGHAAIAVNGISGAEAKKGRALSGDQPRLPLAIGS